jgi:hypothetical protein
MNHALEATTPRPFNSTIAHKLEKDFMYTMIDHIRNKMSSPISKFLSEKSDTPFPVFNAIEEAFYNQRYHSDNVQEQRDAVVESVPI